MLCAHFQTQTNSQTAMSCVCVRRRGRERKGQAKLDCSGVYRKCQGWGRVAGERVNMCASHPHLASPFTRRDNSGITAQWRGTFTTTHPDVLTVSAIDQRPQIPWIVLMLYHLISWPHTAPPPPQARAGQIVIPCPRPGEQAVGGAYSPSQPLTNWPALQQ